MGCSKGTSVRLQIPLGEDAAEEVAYLAERMERSQAWMAARLLEESVGDQGKFFGWLDKFVVHTAGQTVRFFSKKSRRPRHEQRTVRLQVPISSRVVEKVSSLGERLNHTPVQMAGLLIEWALTDHGWLIEVITTKWGKALTKALYATAEHPDAQAEPKDSSMSNRQNAA